MKTKLKIKTKLLGNKTVIDDVYFTSPLKIARPIYEKNEMKIIIMSASAGILSGDEYDMNFEIGTNSKVHITDQSYTKIFKMNSGEASQNINIHVEENASLKYFPKAVIPFKDSKYHTTNKIYLKESSKFYYKEIFGCGRIAMGEKFHFEFFKSKIMVYIEDKLVFLDNTTLIPKEVNLSKIGFFEGYTHQGLMYIYSDEEFNINENNDKVVWSKTKCKKGICIRCLAKSADDIEEFFEGESK